MKMPNGKGQVELARERLVKAVNQVLGVVRRNGRGRKVGLALVLMVLTEGQREERGRDVRVGLREPAGGAGGTGRRVEGLPGGPLGPGEGSGCRNHRRHRGPQRSRGRGVSPQGNYWIYCHAHGRFERAKLLTVTVVDLSTGRAFMVSPTP